MIFGTSLTWETTSYRRANYVGIRKKTSILTRKASSNICFHYSPFSLYCLKYSLDIKKLRKIQLTVAQYEHSNFEPSSYSIVWFEYILSVVFSFFYCIFISHIQTCLLAVAFLRPMPSIDVLHSAPSRNLGIVKVKTSYGIFYITGHENVLYPSRRVWTVNFLLLHAPP